jgi:two-component system cell cycle sensor histidine kinase/response regulator CckA
VTALRDVTERRTLEEQFRQVEKMEAVGRLAGGVAHDLSNLLTVIMSYAEILLGDLAANNARPEDVAQIQKAATDAATLTGQLLGLSRLQVIAPRLVALIAPGLTPRALAPKEEG